MKQNTLNDTEASKAGDHNPIWLKCLHKIPGLVNFCDVWHIHILVCIFQGLSGGTTVSATMIAAHRAGITVFVTGGIGGVHRDGQNSEQTCCKIIFTVIATESSTGFIVFHKKSSGTECTEICSLVCVLLSVVFTELILSQVFPSPSCDGQISLQSACSLTNHLLGLCSSTLVHLSFCFFSTSSEI